MNTGLWMVMTGINIGRKMHHHFERQQRMSSAKQNALCIMYYVLCIVYCVWCIVYVLFRKHNVL